MHEISSLAELKNLSGQEVAVSEWFPITQERIGLFAAATGDHQWIHLDEERCKKESPFGSTIAHGFLTLSLLPMFIERTIRLSGVKLIVNYGVNRVRFPAPVPVDSLVRARMLLQSVKEMADGAQTIWQFTVERENGTKPVCVAELIILVSY